ncbi:hypothetical protein J6590_100728 [Homalodisca vitripennis]|nr:hypothetical protein J6590_100728 [Homalodisca vitripennis]
MNIINLKRFDHVSPYRDAAGMMSVETVCRVMTCCMVHKALVNQEPQYLSEKLSFRDEVSQRRTRHGNLLHFPKVRLELGRRSFSYFGPKLYNDLPPNHRPGVPVKVYPLGVTKHTDQSTQTIPARMLLHKPQSTLILNPCFIKGQLRTLALTIIVKDGMAMTKILPLDCHETQDLLLVPGIILRWLRSCYASSGEHISGLWYHQSTVYGIYHQGLNKSGLQSE